MLRRTRRTSPTSTSSVPSSAVHVSPFPGPVKASEALDACGVEPPLDPELPPDPALPPDPELPPDPDAVETAADVLVVVGATVVVDASDVVVVVGASDVVVVVGASDVVVVVGASDVVVVEGASDVVVVVGASDVVVVVGASDVVVVVDASDVVVVVGASDVVVVDVGGVTGCAIERIRPAPRSSDPAAKQALMEGHAKAPMSPVTDGTTWAAQVEPPSPLAKICPSTASDVAFEETALAASAVEDGRSRAAILAPNRLSRSPPTTRALRGPLLSIPSARRARATRTAWSAPPVSSPPSPLLAASTDSPPTKHDEVVGTHATPVKGPASEGRATDCHVEPPSALDSSAALTVPSELETVRPTARQEVADSQLTPSSSLATAGTTLETQVVPPSAVVRISAAPSPDWSPLSPTATHVVASAQLTSLSGPVPAGTDAGTHVVPPSVVSRTEPVAKSGLAPTATQAVGDVQSIPLIGPVPAGTVWVAHVLAPSVVAMMTPCVEVALVTPDPTARQSLAEVQSIDSSRALLRVSLTHVVPPSVVVSTTVPLVPAPRAKQSVAVGQLTWLNGPVPVGNEAGVHVEPPSEVPRTWPLPISSAPDVRQLVVEVQATASKSPVLEGTACEAHVVPPSVLWTITGVSKSVAVPTDVQVVEVPQSIPMRSPATAGAVSAFHVVPPLVDKTISAADPSWLLPAATQVVELGHDTADRSPALAGTVRAAHVVPPFALEMM